LTEKDLNRNDALRGAVAYFTFLKSIGIDYVQSAPPETESLARAPMPPREKTNPQQERSVPTKVETPQKESWVTKPSVEFPSTSIKQTEQPPTNNKIEQLDTIRKEVEECESCGLSKTRNMVVFGTGNPNAKIMFVGEAPGEEEDKQGKPFVGKAGNLLTKMIEAINLSRDEVFIANVLKCRPPDNRNPKPEEVSACDHFLIRQIKSVNPLVLCALGTHAAHTLLKSSESIGRLRGKFYDYHGVPLLPTYHPSFLLRSPSYKKLAWEDLQLLRDEAKKLAK